MSSVKVEFAGGLELLFSSQKQLTLQCPPEVTKIRHLIAYLKEKYLKERPELFVQGDTVRPGILVLVNEVDWELCDGLEYALQPNDTILFISTLHGG